MSEQSAEDNAFLERVGERHFPWWYTEYGVVCSCSRACPRGGEECPVMLRARRWAGVIPPARP